jgi:hypothetical protein
MRQRAEKIQPISTRAKRKASSNLQLPDYTAHDQASLAFSSALIATGRRFIFGIISVHCIYGEKYFLIEPIRFISA